MTKKFLLTLLLFIIKSNLFSQDFYILNRKMTIKKDVVNEVTYNKPYNSISLRTMGDFDFSKFKIMFKNNHSEDYHTLSFSKDEHIEINQSNLAVFDNAQHFVFWSEEDIELEMIFQYVKPLNEVQNHLATKRSLCDEPIGIIPQSTWRTGLPDPVKGRTATPTKHCVIHHSADGNGNTNYTQLVRSYYIHHTQTNGWDDIGYNYLIAANGSIFAGRDPEKNSIRQDNVLGAHFCGKNVSTMGICLIGNYNSTSPSDSMINSLIHLLSWKYVKDTLNPISEFFHPDNNGNLLKALVGHKDGCATQCPGDSVYSKISDLKAEVFRNYLNCLPFVSVHNIDKKTIPIIFPNPSNGILNFDNNLISEIEVIDLKGVIITKYYGEKLILNNGVYILKLKTTKNDYIFQKLYIYNDN